MFKTASLIPDVINIVDHKATEPPFTGDYADNDQPGTYLCRRCGLALFRAKAQFHSGCGWASFDDIIINAVKEQPDADGRRTEIVCQRCDAHLGHVFRGEHLTSKNTRHCLNSLSLDFVTALDIMDSKEIIVAGGCFWGVEYFLQRFQGVVKTEVGYIGGKTATPTYQAVCRGDTGHYEGVRVVYDVQKMNDEQILKYFFEIHTPTQHNGQGPDIGSQYLSAIFYNDDQQKTCASQLIEQLKHKGYDVTTRLLPIATFWPAEAYHQHYYDQHTSAPYCHRYEQRF